MSYAPAMNVPQPPRRQAAIKATSHLAELSSSDEEESYKKSTKRKGHKSAKKLKKDGSASKLPRTKGLTVVPDVDSPGRAKRRRDGSTPNGSPLKRQCVPNYIEGLYGAQADSDESSELTSLSSDDEREGRRAATSTLPFFFHSPPSSSKITNAGHGRNTMTLRSPKVFNRDDDVGEHLDVETAIPHNTIIKGGKFKTPSKTIAVPSDGISERGRRNREDSPLSSTPFPPSSLPLRSYEVLTDDDTETDNGFLTPSYKSLRHVSSLNFDDDDDDDDDVDVLGDELCFAKAKASETVYWPAKVLAVEKGSKARSKDRVNGKQRQRTMFRVLFLDKMEKVIPRTWLYTCDQQEFATCKLGEFISDHVEFIDDIEVQSIHPSNNAGPFFLSQISSATPDRSRSPSPTDLPPTSEAFCDLPLRKQFAYVKPVLKAIMNEEYEPGLRRHRLFFKGGMHRERLRKEGGLRGAMDVRSVEDLIVLVQRWCLGDRPVTGENHEKIGMDKQEEDIGRPSTSVEDSESHVQDAVITVKGDLSALRKDGQDDQASNDERQDKSNDQVSTSRRVTLIHDDLQEGQRNTEIVPFNHRQPQNSGRPPQHGSQEYESLSFLDKLLYCVEVLLPEAILQILLWRSGTRNAKNAIIGSDPEEEERLYNRGEDLLRQTDWVMDVMRLRDRMRRHLEVKEKKPSTDSMRIKGKGKVRKTRSGRFGGVVGRYKE